MTVKAKYYLSAGIIAIGGTIVTLNIVQAYSDGKIYLLHITPLMLFASAAAIVIAAPFALYFKARAANPKSSEQIAIETLGKLNQDPTKKT